MKMRFNHKINLILLYSIATCVCMAAVLYFIVSYKALQTTQKQLHEAQRIFDQTNGLVVSLNTAQRFSEMYVATRNPNYLKDYRAVIDTSFPILDTLSLRLPDTFQEQWMHLSNLFEQKEVLLRKFSARRNVPNYDHLFPDRPNRSDTNTAPDRIESKIERDTVFSSENRGFFRRLGRLFSSAPKPIQTITIRRSDSVIRKLSVLQSAPTTPIDTVIQTVESDYKKHVETLEDQYVSLLSSDRRIGRDISTILIRLNQNAVESMIATMLQKDRSIRQTLFAGSLAFLVVIAFVFMIFISAQRSLRRSHESAESKRITEELMQSRHQLLLSISHDIKAPLCSILSYLEFWDKENLSTDEIRQLSSMQNSATHILDMLTNLLEFSRLEQKKTQIQNQTFEPIPLFLEIVDLFKPMTVGKGIKFLYHFTNLNDRRITTDVLKLRQITTNLVSNAVKYTTQGEIRLCVEYLAEPDRLRIIVSDTGIGIPQDKLNTLFDSFMQIENRSANIEGSGLGLFVVKGLIEVMHGKINVESSEKGSVFEVKIPILQL